MKVTVIDYGLSNLLSVRHAFAHFGAETLLTSDPADVLAAEKLVLPGVGAFKDGMDGLARLGLIEPIRQKAAAGTPLLGICLGMQMLFDESEEFGLHKGLGLIPGRVVKIPATDVDGPSAEGAAHQLGSALPRRRAHGFFRHGAGRAQARRGVLFYPQLRGQARPR